MSYDEDYEEEPNVTETSDRPDTSGITIIVTDYMVEKLAVSAAEQIVLRAEGKLDKLLAKKMDEIFTEAFEAKIGAVAEVAVQEWLSRPRKKTNCYGEVVGAEKTLAESVEGVAEKWLTERVRNDGTVSSYHNDNVMERYRWIAQSLVINEVKKAAEDAAKKVAEEAKRAVAASVGRYIADQLVPKVDVPKLVP